MSVASNPKLKWCEADFSELIATPIEYRITKHLGNAGGCVVYYNNQKIGLCSSKDAAMILCENHYMGLVSLEASNAKV